MKQAVKKSNHSTAIHLHTAGLGTYPWTYTQVHVHTIVLFPATARLVTSPVARSTNTKAARSTIDHTTTKAPAVPTAYRQQNQRTINVFA